MKYDVMASRFDRLIGAALIAAGALAGATSTARAADTVEAPPDQQSEEGLAEVLVTAQKRQQRLQDVPVPVSVVETSELAKRSEYRIQDFYDKVPGLQMTPNQLGGTATVAIRGVVSGDFSAPTVGITVDDLPFGSSTLLGGGFLVPDLDPSDLAHVEVLRGPQGTFYGASSIGGLVKYVTKDPSTDRFSGQVRAGLTGVSGSSDHGYSVGGAVNVPLTDTLAMRASGFTRRDPGYIDNIGYVEGGGRDTNRTSVSGGNLSALWRPSAQFSLKLSALLQDSKISGSPFVTRAEDVADLEQRFLPGTGHTNRKFGAYSAIAKLTLGEVELTSLTGYSRTKLDDSYDVTEHISPGTVEAFPESSGFTNNVDFTQTTKFTQELRAAVPLGKRVDLLVGAFYTKEKTPWLEEYLAADSSGATLGQYAHFDFGSEYRDEAAFTNFTFHLTDRFDIQVGGRWSRLHQSLHETDSGPFVEQILGEGIDVLPYPNTSLKEHTFTYLFSPQFRVAEDTMVYARLASGYRPGGINAQVSLFGFSETFEPDETRNYELGIKTSLFGNRLYLDGSVYYIDWKKVQTSVSEQSLTFFSNGGSAKSQGIELTAHTTLAGFDVNAWLSWCDAVLAENFPENSIVAGVEGDRLPFSSRFSGNLSVEYKFALGQHVGTVGGDFSFVGDRVGNFQPGPERQNYPGYAKFDLRAGLQVKDWDVSLFVNNVTNKRGVLGGGIGTTISDTAFTLTQPRTVGLGLAKDF